MKKGDKKLKGSRVNKLHCMANFITWLGTFFSGIFSSKGERADQAIENYKSAATKFKLANECKEIYSVKRKSFILFLLLK